MKFELYRSLFRRQWRWRLKARNGRIIANSGESYVNRRDCLDAIHLIRTGAAAASVATREEPAS